MTSETVTLPAGQVLTVTAASGFNGTLWRMVAGVSAGSNVVASGSSVAVGPFVSDAQFRIDSDRGQLSYACALEEIVSGSGASPSGINAQAREAGSGVLHKTVVSFAVSPLTLTDDAGVGQYGSIVAYTFPAGAIAVLGAVLDSDLTLVSPFITTAAGDVGVGSTAVTDGDALATTEQNVIVTTEIAALVARVGPMNAASAAGVILNGTASPASLYLNVRIDDNVAHATATTNTFTGTLTVLWSNLGDF